MNNNFKIILVAVISFSLGVMATAFFQTKDHPKPTTQSHINKQETEKTRKPFFVNIKEQGTSLVEKMKGHSLPVETGPAPINSQKDFMALSEAMEDFNNQSLAFLRQKYTSPRMGDRDPEFKLIFQKWRGKLEYMYEQNETSFKANFTDEATNAKVYLIFKYYPCRLPKAKPGMKYNESCFYLSMYVRHNAWYETTVNSSMDGIVWNKDNGYVYVNLNGLGEFSKKLSAVMAVIPIPDDNFAINYLNYDNKAFTWVEGNEVRWYPTNEKDIAKFINWKDSFDSHEEVQQ